MPADRMHACCSHGTASAVLDAPTPQDMLASSASCATALQDMVRLLSLFADSSYSPSAQLQTLALRTLFTPEAPLQPADLVLALQACATLSLGVSLKVAVPLIILGTQVGKQFLPALLAVPFGLTWQSMCPSTA